MENLKYSFYFFFMAIIYSCSNSKKIAETTNLQNTGIDTLWNGEILISQESFIKNIDPTCGFNSLNKDSCILQKIKTDYINKFDTLHSQEISIYKNKTIELRLLKKQVPTTTENQQIKIGLSAFINGKIIDSLICYSYLNNANNSMATEQLYYINNSLEIWLLSITNEETSNVVDWLKQYRIEPSKGKFIQVK